MSRAALVLNHHSVGYVLRGQRDKAKKNDFSRSLNRSLISCPNVSNLRWSICFKRQRKLGLQGDAAPWFRRLFCDGSRVWCATTPGWRHDAHLAHLALLILETEGSTSFPATISWTLCFSHSSRTFYGTRHNVQLHSLSVRF